YVTCTVDTEAPPRPPWSSVAAEAGRPQASTYTIIRACPRHSYVRECKAQVGSDCPAALFFKEANEASTDDREQQQPHSGRKQAGATDRRRPIRTNAEDRTR